MNNQNEVKVCFGSSCFCRGNSEHLETIEEFIRSNKAQEKVDLRGSSCEGKCSEGPLIEINEKKHLNVDHGVLVDLLNQLKL